MARNNLGRRVGRKAVGRHHIGRKMDSHALGLSGRHDLACGFEVLVLDEAAANFSTLSLEEGECHASPDQKGVYAAQKPL